MSDDPRAHESDETPEPSGMASLAGAIGTRNLLIIIMTMPLVFIGILVAIIMVFGGPNKDERARNASAVVSTPIDAGDVTDEAPVALPASAGVLGAAIALPEGAAPGAISLDGDMLAVRVSGGDGDAVVIYDLTQNRVVQTVPLITIVGDARGNEARGRGPASVRIKLDEDALADLNEDPGAGDAAGENEPSTDDANAATVQAEFSGQVRNGLSVQRGVTLAAPGETPPAQLSEDALLDSDTGGRVLAPTIATAPTLAPRRTRFVTTPE